MSLRDQLKHPLGAALTLALAAAMSGCRDSTAPPLGDVVFDFCSFDAPVFFAYQNDGGAWTRVMLDANHAASFPAAARTAFAVVWDRDFDFSTHFVYASGAELRELSVGCAEDLGTKTLHGTLMNLGDFETARVAMGGAVAADATATYDIERVPDGPVDLIAQRNGGGTRPIIMRRGLNIEDGGTIEPMVLSGSLESLEPERHFAFLTGQGTDQAFVYGSFETATSTVLLFQPAVASLGAGIFETLPANKIVDGDVHTLIGLAYDASNHVRYVWEFFGHPEDKTLALGPPIATTTVTAVSSAPFRRFRAQVVSQSEYPSLMRAVYTQDDSPRRRVVVTATRGHFGGVPPIWDVEIPDLTGVDGFLSTWMLQVGRGILWEVTAYEERPELYLNRSRPSDGETGHAASLSGVIEDQLGVDARARPLELLDARTLLRDVTAPR
jgi:hypothetical protein